MKKKTKNILDEVQLNVTPLNESLEGKLLGGFTDINADMEAKWNVGCTNDCPSNDCVNIFCRNQGCNNTTSTTETTTETTIFPDIPPLI